MTSPQHVSGSPLPDLWHAAEVPEGSVRAFVFARRYARAAADLLEVESVRIVDVPADLPPLALWKGAAA